MSYIAMVVEGETHSSLAASNDRARRSHGHRAWSCLLGSTSKNAQWPPCHVSVILLDSSHDTNLRTHGVLARPLLGLHKGKAVHRLQWRSEEWLAAVALGELDHLPVHSSAAAGPLCECCGFLLVCLFCPVEPCICLAHWDLVAMVHLDAMRPTGLPAIITKCRQESTGQKQPGEDCAGSADSGIVQVHLSELQLQDSTDSLAEVRACGKVKLLSSTNSWQHLR